METISHGITSGRLVKPLLVDANGGVILSAKMSRGIDGAVRDRASNTSLAAGTNTLNMTVVPAGVIWFIQSISIRYVGTVTNVLLAVNLLSSAIGYELYKIGGIVSGMEYDRIYNDLVLFPGENIQGIVQNATLNDDLWIHAVGYYTTIV